MQCFEHNMISTACNGDEKDSVEGGDETKQMERGNFVGYSLRQGV